MEIASKDKSSITIPIRENVTSGISVLINEKKSREKTITIISPGETSSNTISVDTTKSEQTSTSTSSSDNSQKSSSGIIARYYIIASAVITFFHLLYGYFSPFYK